MVAPNSATNAVGEKAALVGCKAMSTPTKPTSTAVQRTQPTFSPSTGTDNAVMISGAAM